MAEQPSLGELIRARREELDLTQTDVGALAGVHRATIRMVETDRPTSGKTLANLLRALGCAPSADGSVNPIFGPGTASGIAKALLLASDPAATLDYFGVVSAAWRGDAASVQVERLREALDENATTAVLRAFDAEVSPRFGTYASPPPHSLEEAPRADRGERSELLALAVMVAVLEQLDLGERRRALAYLHDRFGGEA